MKIKIIDVESVVNGEPVYLNDIFAASIGKEIVVYTQSHQFSGTLEEYNGYILHIHNECEGLEHFYISPHKIIAIGGYE